MITLADLTPRQRPIAYARAQLDTHGMLLRGIWSRRGDLVFWSAWLAAAAAFVALAWAATQRYYFPGDPWLAEHIQDLDRFAWAGPLFDTVNALGDFNFIAGLLLVTFVVLLLRGLRFEALMIAGAGLLHYVQLGIRDVAQRPFSLDAPPWFNESFDLRQWPDARSFPSGHVVGEVAVYGLIFVFVGKAIPFRPAVWLVRVACLAQIALGGVGRVYAGAHWPSDVLGGFVLAGLYLAIVWRAAGAVNRVREVNAERALMEDAGLSGAPAPKPAAATVTRRYRIRRGHAEPISRAK